jgi:4-hydroxythreonine-4-phosphate dehydrogenase
MIHITQGHQKGVGLEVLFKSLVFFNQKNIEQMILYASQKDILNTLEFLPYVFSINHDSIHIHGKSLKCYFIENSKYISTDTLTTALNVIKPNDVLFTLPTSKEQLIHNSEVKHGYTEFFRSYFDKNNIAMIFMSNKEKVALLSDHIPISAISNTLSLDFIKNKTLLILNSFQENISNLDEVIMTGINPHSGENGRLGIEDNNVEKALIYLKSKFKNIKFNSKPIPADTVQYHRKNNINQLIIYSSHDQALATFKDRNGILGLNITLGLPFLRISVDHGTAFELYQKNKADSTGCYYCLKQALLWNNKS